MAPGAGLLPAATMHAQGGGIATRLKDSGGERLGPASRMSGRPLGSTDDLAGCRELREACRSHRGRGFAGDAWLSGAGHGGLELPANATIRLRRTARRCWASWKAGDDGARRTTRHDGDTRTTARNFQRLAFQGV